MKRGREANQAVTVRDAFSVFASRETNADAQAEFGQLYRFALLCAL
jgi:hypothetical protein